MLGSINGNLYRTTDGRTLAYAWRENGLLMVNEHLAAEGYPLQLTIPPDVKYAEQFRADVQIARDNCLGL